LGIGVLLSVPAVAADSYTIDRAHSEALFKIRHLVSHVSGRFKQFSGTIQIEPDAAEASSVKLVIEAASIDTDNDRRDQHLRSEDFFWVEKHPEITFTSSAIRPASGSRYIVTGTLTMRGVSKQIELPVDFLGFVKDAWGNDKAGFSLQTTINRKDFGIEWNQALDQGGFVLGDEVQVEFNIQAQRQQP
jgi:polyisoprenoid-binding protein YceI